MNLIFRVQKKFKQKQREQKQARGQKYEWWAQARTAQLVQKYGGSTSGQIIALLKPKFPPDSLSSYLFLYLPQYKKVPNLYSVTYIPQHVLRRHGSDSNKLISTIPCTTNYTTNMV